MHQFKAATDMTIRHRGHDVGQWRMTFDACPHSLDKKNFRTDARDRSGGTDLVTQCSPRNQAQCLVKQRIATAVGLAYQDYFRQCAKSSG